MRILRDRHDNRLFPTLTIKVFEIENRGYTRRFFRTRGKVFSRENVDSLIAAVAEDLDKKFPRDQWEAVEVGPGAINIVWRGKREAPATVPAAKA